jgi:hypothetical protein
LKAVLNNMANKNPDVRLLILPEELYAYLVFIFESHSKGGIDPNELLIASELWKRISASPKVDFSDLGKARLENLSPNGATVSLEPENKEDNQG